MHIAILGSIATHELLPEATRQRLGSYPAGRAGAPLITNLVLEYLARGHRVLALTTDTALPDNAPPFVVEEGRLIYVVVPARRRIFRPNGPRLGRVADFYRFERRGMLAVLRHYQPEVVHAHWTYEFALAALAYSPDALITVHDNARVIFGYLRNLERLFMLWMARRVFRTGRWFTAVSPYMADSVQPWTKAKVAVVPNPVVLPAGGRRAVPPPTPVVSVVVNGWDERKNSPKALLVFKALQRQHPDAQLRAMGTAFAPDGPAAAFCREHAIHNVTLLGPRPHAEVLHTIAHSSLLLHTSLEESFGMVLAEAMSYGVPVVAGKWSGAVPWVVGEGGLLVDVTNVEETAAAAHRLLTEPDLYARLSEAGVRTVETRFAIQAIASQFLTLYQKISLYAVKPDFNHETISETPAFVATPAEPAGGGGRL